MPDDLRLWLRRIGLEQCAETLAANDIDLDVLPDLTDEDLKELRHSLGHRRRPSPPAVARDCRAVK